MKFEKVTISNEFISADVINYAGTLTSLKVKDKNGRATEVILGYDDFEMYQKQDKFLGALVGRNANRIGGAKFTLDGTEYKLTANEGENQLHGGNGFWNKVWDIISFDKTSVTLGITSPDGEEGFPGNLDIKVTYSLDGNKLHIDYEATSDKDTVCNLTSHGYFNLSGDKDASVEDHYVTIFADKYTPTDEHSIPTGEIADVAGTPLDLRKETRVGDHIDDDNQQIKYAAGYDHNFVINGTAGELRAAAEMYSKISGIRMKFYTDQAGMQFYSGNWLEPQFKRRSGFCFESQTFPDSPNKKNFSNCVLRKGEKYIHKAVFCFEHD
ncbi:MAG: aldose epimerase family protein [Bacillota bacterium]|nr:aldose epimerase family protein [Bacillota bacterium]